MQQELNTPTHKGVNFPKTPYLTAVHFTKNRGRNTEEEKTNNINPAAEALSNLPPSIEPENIPFK